MNEPVTRERIDKAIAWYWANRAEITESLPISTPGVTFLNGWTESMECRIKEWRAGEHSVFLAAAYIHAPIRSVAKVVKASVSTEKV